MLIQMARVGWTTWTNFDLTPFEKLYHTSITHYSNAMEEKFIVWLRSAQRKPCYEIPCHFSNSVKTHNVICVFLPYECHPTAWRGNEQEVTTSKRWNWCWNLFPGLGIPQLANFIWKSKNFMVGHGLHSYLDSWQSLTHLRWDVDRCDPLHPSPSLLSVNRFHPVSGERRAIPLYQASTKIPVIEALRYAKSWGYSRDEMCQRGRPIVG